MTAFVQRACQHAFEEFGLVKITAHVFSHKASNSARREWDQKYGEGNWAVGYLVDGAFVLQEDALDSIYTRNA